MSRLRAVFFDVDDTLVDFDAAATRAHAELFGGEDYADWHALTPEFWARFTSGELAFEAMRAARMARYLELTGRADDPVEFEARRWELVERGFELYPDVAGCLARVRAAGLLVGVITNNESRHQRRKLTTVGLLDDLDAVIISGEVGVAKPDAEIFRLACRRLGVGPAEAAHVGDLLDVDAQGAAAAGLRGVWLDRRAAHDGAALDLPVISGLSELDGVLGFGRAETVR